MAYIAQVALNFDPKFLLVLALVALVLLFVLSGNSKRRDAAAAAAGRKRCPSCAGEHPGFARFCRKCGTKLPE
jgi:hypothetical protein